MTALNVTMNNVTDPTYQTMFDSLIKEVFGFSFQPWFELGLLDDRYESYSIIEDGKMLANVCIYKADLLIHGKPVRAHQFGAVATRKSARGGGLARFLTEHVLAKYPTTPAYLHANPTVVDFYPRFGFKQVQTFCPGIEISVNNPDIVSVKIAPSDLLFPTKWAVSKALDSINNISIKRFHLLMSYSNCIYHLPKNGATVIAVQEENELFLADVISPIPIAFDDLVKELPFVGVDYVEFGFNPDWLGVEPQWEESDDLVFVRGSWDLPQFFRFPAMSET